MLCRERMESMRLCASSITTMWLSERKVSKEKRHSEGEDALLEGDTESLASRLLHQHVVRKSLREG
jgi:hypothetical protein